MTTEQNNNAIISRGSYAYLGFSSHVRQKSRYIHGQYTQPFLNSVIETSKNRETFLAKDTVCWRAQLGCAKSEGVKFVNMVINQKDIPYPPERMKPLADRAKEGRANPKGIPCLYLATNMQTAIQEIRPWLETKISVAQFRIVRDLKIVNCSKNIPKNDDMHIERLKLILNKDKSLKECEEFTWSWIDKAFSMPVDPSDDNADYVPTQILAELFKSAGYDGIIYNSLFAEGKNVALFDLDSAEFLDCKLCKVTKIPAYEYQEIRQ